MLITPSLPYTEIFNIIQYDLHYVSTEIKLSARLAWQISVLIPLELIWCHTERCLCVQAEMLCIAPHQHEKAAEQGLLLRLVVVELNTADLIMYVQRIQMKIL